MDKKVGFDLRKFVLVEKKPKTWRNSILSLVLFFASLLTSGYFVFWGALNVFAIDLKQIVGFDSFYANFVIGFALFTLLTYVVYLLIFNFIIYLTYGFGVCSIYGRDNIRSYFFFWFALRNFALAVVYLLVLVFPALLGAVSLIKMILTLACLIGVFFDIKQNVVGDVISLFTLKRFANIFIVYYLISIIIDFVGVV